MEKFDTKLKKQICFFCNGKRFVYRNELHNNYDWLSSTDDTKYSCHYCMECVYCGEYLIKWDDCFNCFNCNVRFIKNKDYHYMYYNDNVNKVKFCLHIFKDNKSIIYWENKSIVCFDKPNHPNEVKDFIKRKMKILILQ